MASPSVALDLGTTTTYLRRTDRFLLERFPSAVAISTRTGQLAACGEPAAAMLERTPAEIRACRPLVGSVIADYDMAVLMLHEFFTKIQAVGFMKKPNVVVGIPCGVTEVERRAVEDVLLDAGAKSVRTVPQILAAAYGAGIKVGSTRGSLIVDIGGGSTECALLTGGSIIHAKTAPVAGDEFDRAIMSYLRTAFGLIVGEGTANRVKHTVGVAHPSIDRGSMTVSGRSVETGRAMTVEVSSVEVCEALRRPIAQILLRLRATLEASPPELVGDISKNGLVLCGGSAALPGIAKAIANGTGIRVATAKKSEECVIQGLSHILTSHIPPARTK